MMGYEYPCARWKFTLFKEAALSLRTLDLQTDLKKHVNEVADIHTKADYSYVTKIAAPLAGSNLEILQYSLVHTLCLITVPWRKHIWLESHSILFFSVLSGWQNDAKWASPHHAQGNGMLEMYNNWLCQFHCQCCTIPHPKDISFSSSHLTFLTLS